jgi:tetratricopeptide (TPR) repeat protein
MPIIRIEEKNAPGTDGSNATISFDHGPKYPIAVNNPFSEEAEERLAWYFEEHLEFPFTKQVRAQEAAGSITTYGEALFEQVFKQNADVYAEYRTILKAGLHDLFLEIAGTPPFHAPHWEALKDPNMAQALALQATMVRKNLQPQPMPSSLHPSPTINLLLVTARPSVERDVGYRTISRPLVEALRNANLPVQVDIVRPGTYRALENHLREATTKYGEGHYHVVHFDVHGAVLTYRQFQRAQQEREASRYVFQERYGRADLPAFEDVKGFLSFEDEQAVNVADLVEASELADLLTNHHIPIAILNACQSGKQIGARETSLGSRLVQAGAQLVLAMGYSITVSAAELLMRALYTHLFAGDDLSVAIRHARVELSNHKQRRAYFDQRIDLEDWLLPVVYQNRPLALKPVEFTPEERAAWFERKGEEERYTPPDPAYGFVGRDVDILQIEKRLLTRRNVLLMRGMGGAGKTTLLRNLAAWWHKTGFVRRLYYFGYDERAWTLQQILTTIAQDLYGPRYYTDFQPLSPQAQQAMLAQRLRAEPHLLMLDNLESITGAHLAIQHTLPKAEQEALRAFLARLVIPDIGPTSPAKGHTLVLLGSRGGEDWLARGTFDDNIYDLGGLDKEAASILADRILEKAGATHYRGDEHLRTLLNVLDGFPLAMEVVLANLRQQAPKEVLEALQAGDVRLDIEESKQQGKDIFAQKTESILRCIDYSHSNLSPDAQQLLLCLAPFTSVIWIDESVINNYINELKQQPVLSALPFDRWTEVIREAQNWGLLGPDPEIDDFLRLQPTLTYFLRNRLHESGQAEIKQAIETAFREHYDAVSGELYQLLNSKKPQEKQVGQLLMRLEYENLVTALNLALAAQVSILDPYRTLSGYLDATQDQRRGLELGQMVLRQLEGYSSEKLAEQLGFEFAGVIDDIAKRQLLLKQYKEAEASYQKALSFLLENKAEEIRKLSASVYHQLGRVAQEQRQWAQAEQYYQQALQLFVEYNDRYSQASTYHQLGTVAQEQRQWAQAREYFLRALEIYATSDDTYYGGIVVRSLARLWRDSSDVGLPAAIAAVLGISEEEAAELIRRSLQQH